MGFEVQAEFDRQVATLIDKGYPALSGLSEESFTGLVAPLRRVAVDRGEAVNPPTPARVPFVLVITLVPPEETMALTELRGRPGHAAFEPDDLRGFSPIEHVPVPAGPAYLMFDVDRGKETLNVTPDRALETITAQRRSPLTVDEGIALITHYPQALEKNNCFSLAGSRHGDRRVPALWISRGAPKLGWCWAGNPHSWLGTASCAGRAGSPAV
ncbi:MAG TPA: DUF5701 family protein [Pseudonocardiaceae bacterium]|nr:DUF5701 family protein [Pseudonocardiaceae bacterium]